MALIDHFLGHVFLAVDRQEYCLDVFGRRGYDGSTVRTKREDGLKNPRGRYGWVRPSQAGKMSEDMSMGERPWTGSKLLLC